MNHYDLLGISWEASTEELEERYHELAKKYHPDKCKVPEAHKIFIRIKEAYETLSDPQKKKAYDESIESVASGEGFKNPARKNNSTGSSPNSGENRDSGGAPVSEDIQDIFKNTDSSPKSGDASNLTPDSKKAPDSPETQCSPQTYSLSFVPVGGSNSETQVPFRASAVSYVPFRKSPGFKGPCRTFSTSRGPEWFKNAVCKNGSLQFKNSSYKRELQSPVRPFTDLNDQEKIKADLKKKARGLPVRFIMRKLLQYCLILIFVLLVLMLNLPSTGATDSPYLEKIEIVIKSLKSFNI